MGIGLMLFYARLYDDGRLLFLPSKLPCGLDPWNDPTFGHTSLKSCKLFLLLLIMVNYLQILQHDHQERKTRMKMTTLMSPFGQYCGIQLIHKKTPTLHMKRTSHVSQLGKLLWATLMLFRVFFLDNLLCSSRRIGRAPSYVSFWLWTLCQFPVPTQNGQQMKFF